MFKDSEIVDLMFQLVQSPLMGYTNIIIYIKEDNYSLFLDYYKETFKKLWKEQNICTTISKYGISLYNSSPYVPMNVIVYNGEERTRGKRAFFTLYDDGICPIDRILCTDTLGGFHPRSIDFSYLKEKIQVEVSDEN